MRLLWMFLPVLALAASNAFPKDLSERLGVGYSNQFGSPYSMPSIAVRYYPNQQYGMQASVGVDTEKNQNEFGAAVKFIKIVFREDNMNFYVAANGGILSVQQGTTSSGFDGSATFGGEFFLPGLDSLGFSFEAGVGVTSVASNIRFRTMGDSPLTAGMFFYF